MLRGDQYIVQKVDEHEGLSKTFTSTDHMKPWMEFANDDSDNERENRHSKANVRAE